MPFADLMAVPVQIEHSVAELMQAIDEGATSFLTTEYKYVGIFMVRLPAHLVSRRVGYNRLAGCSVGFVVCTAALCTFTPTVSCS